jgi:signal transduction histidine kinase
MLKNKKPTLTQYIVGRSIMVSVFMIIFYLLAVILTPHEYQNTLFHMGIFGLSLLFILAVIYRTINRITMDLKLVEGYLSQMDSFDTKRAKVKFSTKEFEHINIRLIQLLRKIKKRDKKKQKQTAKIKLKNRQRSNMLSAIAHEFRNPIAAIMGYAQTINDDADIPPQLRQRFLSKIYNNGEKIEDLLSRLLLWNRFESGEQKLQLSKFDMQPLILEVALNLEDKYKNREIVIEEKALVVRADRALMEIVLKNLIENALKYSHERVEVKIEQGRVLIVDKGVGISSDNIDKVTKKFFRTEQHSWDNSMGLGLSIVKQILRLHNTTLDIASQEDVGSTFSFFHSPIK